MTWSHSSLLMYLYGIKHEHEYVDNKLVITPEKIDFHYKGEEPIPSGFFEQENSENISAVLSTSCGTISKFNRIGRQAGFGAKDVIMLRTGTCHNHDPNAALPKMFKYYVNEQAKEIWGEGISIYHNPNAKHPLEPGFFNQVAHHHFEKGQIVSYLPDFFPYNSFTHNICLNDC